MPDFSHLVTALPPIERKTVCIEMTEIFPGVTFTYRDMQTREIFSLPGLMEAIAYQHEDYPPELTGIIAILAACHVAPVSEEKGLQTEPWLLYCEMAERLPHEKWEWLVQQFMAQFPHLKDFDEAVEERKKK
jgi:hypothetical protein